MNPAPSRLENSAFYILLASIVLAPLAFWPTVYAPFDLVKAIVIGLGALVPAIILAYIAFKERRLVTIPHSIFWTGLLLCISTVISALLSSNVMKSLFGQGFEVGTASFILVLFVAACAVFGLVKRDGGRAVVLFAGMVASFLILYVFHVLRLIIGPNFAGFGVLTNATSTIFGGWYALGAFALVVGLVAVAALIFLPLSRRLRIFYWVLLVLAGLGVLVVNDMRVWIAAAVVFLGLAIYESARRAPSGAGFKGFLRHLAWMPLVIGILAALIFWKGGAIANSVANKVGAAYIDSPSLSWRGTLDVGSGAMKAAPLFGIGPNRFSQAYLANKPADVNASDVWNLEFSSAWSTLSTFAVTQGLIGTLLWVLLFVLFGIAGARALKRLPEDPQSRFVVVSSLTSATFLWLMALLSVLPHALLFLAFVMSAIFLASAAASGSLTAFEIVPKEGSRSSKLIAPIGSGLVILVLVVWAVIFVKNTVAFAYFASGMKAFTSASTMNDLVKADTDFAAANKLNPSDVFLQARVEAGIAAASNLVGTLTSSTPASTTQAVAAQAATILNNSLTYATQAVKLDPTNYYNYVSEARAATAGARLQIPNAYEIAVAAYTSAISLNPGNPSLYLSLSQLQASANKLDDGLQTVAAALRVKNNYLDAVFLLSQIEAAKGNLPDAITAAQFAAQLNPQSPVVFFQLGLLEYENKSYSASAQAFAAALKIQPDYANAQYFLGLADARLGNMTDALTQFQSLANANPDNQEVLQILTMLQSGRSPFADAQAAVAAAPEKAKSLPIKSKK